MTYIWGYLLTVAVIWLLLDRWRAYQAVKLEKRKSRAMEYLIKDIKPQETESLGQYLCESKGTLGTGNTKDEARKDWFDTLWVRMGMER